MTEIYWFDNEDPEMQQAFKRAQASFRYLWRELSWERRRIVPALAFSAIKTVFADRPIAECSPRDYVEHMWLNEIEFDGHNLKGKLMNQPNRLKSVKKGDTVTFSFEQLTDWMFSHKNRVYGAFTVNLIRSRMNPAERRKHDEAWGLDFGDPSKILLTITGQTDDSDETDHPMSVNMGASLLKHLKENPGSVNKPDERGWTFLHNESLAGNSSAVEILLQHGADRSLKTNLGNLPIDLAKIMRWQKIVNLLQIR